MKAIRVVVLGLLVTPSRLATQMLTESISEGD